MLLPTELRGGRWRRENLSGESINYSLEGFFGRLPELELFISPLELGKNRMDHRGTFFLGPSTKLIRIQIFVGCRPGQIPHLYLPRGKGEAQSTGS